MDASIFWENPGLVLLGILAGIFLILLLPIVSAVRRSREEKARDSSLRLREPSVHGDLYDDYAESYDDDDYVPDYDGEQPPGRRGSRSDRDEDEPAAIFGAGPRRRKTARAFVPVRSIWFLTGVCVGAGGLALWSNPPTFDALNAVMASLDAPESPPAADQAEPDPPESKAQERLGVSEIGVAVPPAAVGADDEVGELVASFVTNLKAQLPMEVGPGITMVNVDTNGNVVALGFTISHTVGEEEAPKLQNELENRFRANVCSTPPAPTNIHGLNERGVAFLINYVDLLGKNVAGLTVDPNFCSGPA